MSPDNHSKIVKNLGLTNASDPMNNSQTSNSVTSPISGMPSSGRPGFYTVKDGENLLDIARNLLGSDARYREIMELNGLNNNNVYSGQVIRIPLENSSGYLLYRVKRGDTLWEVAQRFLGDGSKYSNIMNINGLTNDMIYAGQILRIPLEKNPSKTYIVQRGDTLWGISKRLLGDGSRYSDIMDLNGLSNDNIKTGQKLKIPSQ